MPITKSAVKKMRQDKKREAHNKKIKSHLRELVKKARLSPTESSVKKAISALDRAKKVGIYHRNKVARLKSRIAKLVKTKPHVLKKPIKPKAEKKTKKTS
jgi:small subunit ribosomal protein S20